MRQGRIQGRKQDRRQTAQTGDRGETETGSDRQAAKERRQIDSKTERKEGIG